jgi:molybdenum cofactor synthesis domain-containing protein
MTGASAAPTAALLIIGNEILSGRTQDVNLNTAAKKLGTIGIPLKEVRVVPDIQDEIVAALNAMRTQYTYVFTTGGIGPTHDDITVDAIAAAFGVKVVEHLGARRLLENHYGDKINTARLRMARVPEGANLIANPVSGAPGMQIDNVYILAGVPDIMKAMMDGVIATLRHGPTIYSHSVSGFIAESIVADELGAIALRYPHLDIGSYPWVRDGRFGTALVTRGIDQAAVNAASGEIAAMLRARSVEPEISMN